MPSETIIVAPENLGAALADDLARHIEIQRRMLQRTITYVQEHIVAEAPRDRGDFAASVRPYRGTPGATWKRGGGGSDAGASEVAAVMQAWRPGEEVGVATDAPQSRKLIFHAGEDRGRSIKRITTLTKKGRKRVRRQITRRTYTKRVAHGWVERIVKDANALAPEEG